MLPILDNNDSHIVVVDDQPENLRVAVAMLSPQFQVHPFGDGERMLHYLGRGGLADLFLLDIVMPGMGGYELCARLRAMHEYDDIPIVFLTALDAPEDEERGLQLGAIDFIIKPFSPAIVAARVRNHVKLSRALRFIRNQKEVLEEMVADRTRELRDKNELLLVRNEEIAAIQDVSITAYTSLAESRDNETGEHIKRTQHYVRELAGALAAHPRFIHELDEGTVDLLFKSAPLHDIGKVGIPDAILLKPDRLTADEFEIMKTHTTIGHNAIVRAESYLSGHSSFLRHARDIAFCHQEKWDGSGYPAKLSGTDIPTSARLMAVADVYDALISKRVYKPAFSHEKAVEIMKEGRGSHFDPDILDAFLARNQAFAAIARRYGDLHAPAPVPAPA